MQKKGWKETGRVIKFILFSISAGVIQMTVFALLNELLDWPYWPCYLIALVTSVLWNFTLNRKFTFKSAKQVSKAMLQVFAYYLAFTPCTTILGNYLAETLGWNEYLVTVLNMLLNVSTEYLYNRLVVYRSTLDSAVEQEEPAQNK